MSTIIGLTKHVNEPALQPAAQERVQRLLSKFRGPKASITSHALLSATLSDIAGAEDHRVPTTDVSNDREYTIEVHIGTPGQMLRLNVDTGSSDLWVWSTQLQLDQDILKEHNLYDAGKSSTAKAVDGGRWEIAYADGSSCRGNVYSDNLTIGDITITAQGIQAAQLVSKGHIADKNADGVIGMGWPGWNQAFPKQKLPLEKMMDQKLLDHGLFTSLLKLSSEGAGFYSFGTIPFEDAGVQESDISYTHVDGNTGNWTFQSRSAIVNGKTFNRPDNRAFADTGTSLVYVSDDIVQEIYSNIEGSECVQTGSRKVWYYPETAKVPDVQLAVGNKLFKIPPLHMSYGLPKDGMLYGGIQSRGEGWVDIFGVVFLKGVFVVWDQENSQIGVVERKVA